MIRIFLEKETKDEIEEILLKDQKDSETGIFKQIENNRELLKKTAPNLYGFLYDEKAEKANEEHIKELLLANRKKLKDYIGKFGCISKKKSDTLLKKVFRYDTYSKRKTVVEILGKMNVTVCPYCNRQYIFTLKSGKARPQLDHYYPKNKYPYLALSLYNMVPSCSICNMAKSSLNTIKYPVLYPFEEPPKYDFKFEMQLKKDANFVKVIQGISEDISIKLNVGDDASSVKNQVEKLHLNELYNEHTDYVRDILKSRYINSDSRIDDLYRSFPKLFASVDEVRSLLYMTNIDESQWGKRPLSKLTHDIDEQLRKGKIVYEV